MVEIFDIPEFINEGIESPPALQFTGTTGRSARNNNPLNLEYRPGSYQDKYGAVLEPTGGGKDKRPRFAAFPDMMAGYNAGLDQIRLDAGRGYTLAGFVNKFAPPHENPTAQIIQQYAKSLGVSPDTPLSQIAPEKLIVPMLARESSTRIVGQKEREIFSALKQPRQQGQRAFEPYQIAASGPNIPGPPSGANIFDIPEFKQAPTQTGIFDFPETQPEEPEQSFPGSLLPTLAGIFEPQNMKQKALQYFSQLHRPVLNALGMGVGGLLGAGATAPSGPGAIAGLIGGGTLGYGMSEVGADAIDNYLKGTQPPPLQSSLTKLGTETLPTGALMMMGGEVAGPVLGGVTKGLGTLGKAVLGRLGGAGTKNIEAALKGGEQFTKGMRGEITGEEIVQNAKDAVQLIRDNRAANYQTQLANITPPPGTTAWDLDISPVHNKLRDLMNRYRVKVTPEGAIDTSTMAMDKAGRNRVEEIINEVWGWEDKSPLGLDALKRRLDDFYSDSSQARAFVANLRKKVKDVLVDNVPEYASMTKDYYEATKLIKDLESGLMLRKQGMTGRVTADMTLRRLTSAMRDNFALRGELVDVLGGQAAQDLSGQIAGYNMRSLLPHGLAGTGPVLAGEALLAKFVNPQIWPVLIASSPRVQGEFLRVFGKGLQETKGLSLPIGKLTSYLTFLPKKKPNED